MKQSENKMNAAANARGFTLVEILVAIAISGFVLAALYTAFLAQQRLFHVNEQVAEMQQNLRGAALLMTRDIRMAGYDPTGNAGAQILLAGPHRFQFTQDITGNAGTGPPDGDCDDANENVTYGFSDAIDDGDGIADSGAGNLGRDTGGGFQAIAENIVAIGFAYAYEAGGSTSWAIDTDDNQFLDVELDTNNDGIVDTDDVAGGQDLATEIPYDQITAVQIWILARSRQPDRNFIDNNTYVVGRNVITPAMLQRGFRHRLLVTTIELRNRS
jgi:type IV pilus assembly protein PilW